MVIMATMGIDKNNYGEVLIESKPTMKDPWIIHSIKHKN